MNDKLSVEFECECGEKGWVIVNKITKPCPNCGKCYIGKRKIGSLTVHAHKVN